MHWSTGQWAEIAGGGRLGSENMGPRPVPYRLRQSSFHDLLVKEQADRPIMMVLLTRLALLGGAVTADRRLADHGSMFLGPRKMWLRRNLALCNFWGSQWQIV